MLEKKLKEFTKSNEFIILIILIVVMTVFMVINPAFLTMRNMFDLFRTMIVTGIFACGVMMILINGGIDMSFMATSICAAYATVRMALSFGFQGPFILLAAVSGAIGMLLGFCNAYLINKFEIPIFIVTLSMSTVIRGFMLHFIGNEYVASSEMPESTIEFSKNYIFNMVDPTGSSFGLHFSVIIMLAIMVVTHLMLRYTIIGRSVFALGGDPVSASRIGYKISKVRMFIFGYAGLLAGIAGMIYVSNNRMADPMSFQGEELTVTAAVVMGGTSIKGGKGSIIGVFLGLMLTNVINNNLVLINVPSYWQKFTFGMLIILAVLIQSIKTKREQKKQGD